MTCGVGLIKSSLAIQLGNHFLFESVDESVDESAADFTSNTADSSRTPGGDVDNTLSDIEAASPGDQETIAQPTALDWKGRRWQLTRGDDTLKHVEAERKRLKSSEIFVE